MGIFLSTVLVLFVVSAAFRKGCLLMILIPIILGFGYYAYQDQGRSHGMGAAAAPHRAAASHGKAPHKPVASPPDAATTGDTAHPQGEVPPAPPADDLRDNP
jgi:hypothetical protein